MGVMVCLSISFNRQTQPHDHLTPPSELLKFSIRPRNARRRVRGAISLIMLSPGHAGTPVAGVAGAARRGGRDVFSSFQQRS